MIAAFLLGLVGSLHCAGMCGPLVLMTPVVGESPGLSRAVYHAGRICVYALIGILFGAIGESLVFVGLQRWLSILVGITLLIALIAAAPVKGELMRLPRFIKSLFGKFLRQRTFAGVFALGVTNGLLPCGLVYMAATASIAAGDIFTSALQMMAFGVGTLPMLLAIGYARGKIAFSPLFRKLAPLTVAVVALLLVWRGHPLAILKGGEAKSCPACAR